MSSYFSLMKSIMPIFIVEIERACCVLQKRVLGIKRYQQLGHRYLCQLQLTWVRGWRLGWGFFHSSLHSSLFCTSISKILTTLRSLISKGWVPAILKCVYFCFRLLSVSGTPTDAKSQTISKECFQWDFQFHGNNESHGLSAILSLLFPNVHPTNNKEKLFFRVVLSIHFR